ncbi:hypothetical protein EJ377_17485 [Chryseobacterium arthrosphaerae]|nr:hypothetical protein EJ377_17485 [Chryseobacterium arthrosphaerae]
MGRKANETDKLTVEGSVKAGGNFKSDDENPNTVFIPNGKVANLTDEIINDESDYSIRLDPHEYEFGSSSYLDIADDRNRLIHIIGNYIKMTVNFKEIFPKQQIVIYNFSEDGNPMEIRLYDQTIYKVNAHCSLRLYVTRSLRVIAEREQPIEMIW